MLTKKRFTGQDYERIAGELEHLAALVHPEMSHDAAERLKVIAREMRADAKSDVLNFHSTKP